MTRHFLKVVLLLFQTPPLRFTKCVDKKYVHVNMFHTHRSINGPFIHVHSIPLLPPLNQQLCIHGENGLIGPLDQ